MKICLNCQTRFESPEWVCPSCKKAPLQENTFLIFAPEIDAHYPEGAFERLVRIEKGYFWFEVRNRLIIQSIKKYFPRSKNYFEIGCGTGFVLAGVREAFPDIALSGSDIHQEGLKFALNRAPDAHLYQMDARHIPFEREFDAIGLYDVLEHIPEDETTLAQLFQALNPGGGLIITVPQHPFLWSVKDEHAGHQRRYTRQELVEKTRKAGFTIQRVTSFMSLLVPLTMLSNRRLPERAEDYQHMKKFAISSFANNTLYGLLSLERFFIQKGLSLPFGTSLLLIAKRPE